MGNFTKMRTSPTQAAAETQAILWPEFCYPTAAGAPIILKLLFVKLLSYFFYISVNCAQACDH